MHRGIATHSVSNGYHCPRHVLKMRCRHVYRAHHLMVMQVETKWTQWRQSDIISLTLEMDRSTCMRYECNLIIMHFFRAMNNDCASE